MSRAIIYTSDLHFQSTGRSFFQEISCLPYQGIPMVDNGFILKSSSTGMEIPMVLTNKRVIDGDVIDWTFKPIDKNAPIRNVVIVND